MERFCILPAQEIVRYASIHGNRAGLVEIGVLRDYTGTVAESALLAL